MSQAAYSPFVRPCTAISHICQDGNAREKGDAAETRHAFRADNPFVWMTLYTCFSTTGIFLCLHSDEVKTSFPQLALACASVRCREGTSLKKTVARQKHDVEGGESKSLNRFYSVLDWSSRDSTSSQEALNMVSKRRLWLCGTDVWWPPVVPGSQEARHDA